MDHVAFLKKKWGFLEKIIHGEKTVESRWYMHKSVPWDRVSCGDFVYFKNSGSPVTAVAEVLEVLQFVDLEESGVKEILLEYGSRIGISEEDIPYFFNAFKTKRYCMLIFLKNPRMVEHFDIDKKGFGMMSAWITVQNIENIKQKSTRRSSYSK